MLDVSLTILHHLSVWVFRNKVFICSYFVNKEDFLPRLFMLGELSTLWKSSRAMSNSSRQTISREHLRQKLPFCPPSGSFHTITSSHSFYSLNHHVIKLTMSVLSSGKVLSLSTYQVGIYLIVRFFIRQFLLVRTQDMEYT